MVVFLALVGLAAGGGHVGDQAAGAAGLLFVKEALGGVVLGLGLGIAAFLLLREIDNYTVEVLITLSLVTGGYALAEQIGTSGGFAMVVAGLFIGNRGRLLAMSDDVREHLDTFWSWWTRS